jgi:hypothetical protein
MDWLFPTSGVYDTVIGLGLSIRATHDAHVSPTPVARAQGPWLESQGAVTQRANSGADKLETLPPRNARKKLILGYCHAPPRSYCIP